MPKITKRLVDGLRPAGAGDVFTWDTEVRGFGIRVKPTGAGSYLIQYRNAERRTRRLVIGKIGTLTPEEARAIAREKLADVARGLDPSEKRHAARTAVTVADLCALYQDACRSGEKLGRRGKPMKPSTIEGDRLRIDVHVIPLVGKRAVAGLTSDDIQKLKLDIAAGKTAKPKKDGRGGVRTGGRGTSSRVLGMLGTILEFAKTRGFIKDNPARGVAKFADLKRDRFLSPDEFRRIGAAMDALEVEGANRTGIAALRLLALTGLRRGEALSLPWAWVDISGQCLRLGDTKTGAQLRVIGKPAAHLLKMAQTEGRWVFPASRGAGHFIGLPKVLSKVCAQAKVEGISAHVFRHSFASVAAELNYTELTIAGLIGHSAPGVTARYSHFADSALMAAADRVSATIAAMMTGKSADVVDMKNAAAARSAVE